MRRILGIILVLCILHNLCSALHYDEDHYDKDHESGGGGHGDGGASASKPSAVDEGGNNSEGLSKNSRIPNLSGLG